MNVVLEEAFEVNVKNASRNEIGNFILFRSNLIKRR